MHIESTVNVVLKTTTLDKRLLYAINVAANSSNLLVKNTLEALIQGDWEFNMPKKGKNIRKQLKNYIQDEQVITQILQEIVCEAKKDPPRRNDDLMTDSLPQDINLRKLCVRRVAEKTTNLDMKAYLEKMFKNGPSFRKENFFKPCKIKDQELIRETWALLILEALELNQKSANKPKSKAAFTFWLEENNYSTTNKEEHCGRFQQWQNLKSEVKAKYEEMAIAHAESGIDANQQIGSLQESSNTMNSNVSIASNNRYRPY